MKKNIYFLFFLLPILIFYRCGKSRSCCVINLPPVTITSERTSLENQILGSYKEIRRDVWIVSSAKTVEGVSITSTSNTNILNKDLLINKKVIDAVQTLEFDKELVNKYKKYGYIGENNRGFLSYIINDKVENDFVLKEEILNLVKEVNQARLILMLEIINKNDNLTINDLEKVEESTAKLNRESAKKGEWIQLDSGEWILKE